MRRSWAASTEAAGSLARSPPQRWTARLRARASGLAVRKTFTSASGKTTVPMSRPSATTSPLSPSARWWATMTSRTAGTAETGETARSTSAARICSVTSSPLARTRWPDSDATSSMEAARATSATASASAGSTPERRHSSATLRYIAPVSM